MRRHWLDGYAISERDHVQQDQSCTCIAEILLGLVSAKSSILAWTVQIEAERPRVFLEPR